MMLAENRDLLAAQGYDIAYPGRDDIPQGDLRLKLPDPRNFKQWEAKFLPAATAELQRHASESSHAMILSEENIPGRMIHFPSGQFYPAAEVRWQQRRRHLFCVLCWWCGNIRGFMSRPTASGRRIINRPRSRTGVIICCIWTVAGPIWCC